MQYRIYFKKKPLYITDEPDATSTLFQKPNVAFCNKTDATSLQRLIEQMQEKDTEAGVLLAADADTAFAAVKQYLKVIVAGGGLVHNGKQSILMIYRNKKWDLPKGKLDPGEPERAAALREVTEETGLKELQPEQFLTKTYHTYKQDGQLILKESHWYLMQSSDEQPLVPQLEEDIEKCEWVAIDALAPYTENTHPSVIDVLKAGLEVLKIQKKV